MVLWSGDERVKSFEFEVKQSNKSGAADSLVIGKASSTPWLHSADAMGWVVALVWYDSTQGREVRIYLDESGLTTRNPVFFDDLDAAYAVAVKAGYLREGTDG